MTQEIQTKEILTSPGDADEDYQKHILQYVSRTFALTIPQLPADLGRVVSNAYLLCRIADTIEDDNAIDSEHTRRLAELFVQVVAGNVPAKEFSEALYPLLSEQSIEEEHDLIKNTESVIRITHSFNENRRNSLGPGLCPLATAMAVYQDPQNLHGVEHPGAIDDYCYYVAGLVG